MVKTGASFYNMNTHICFVGRNICTRLTVLALSREVLICATALWPKWKTAGWCIYTVLIPGSYTVQQSLHSLY